QKGVVPVIHLVVESRIEELAPQRQLPGVIEVGRKSSPVTHCRNVRDLGYTQLIAVFKICEPEELVLLDWPAQRKPALPPREEGIRIARAPPEIRIGGYVVIAKEEESAAQ